jgi:hypothetical protein
MDAALSVILPPFSFLCKAKPLLLQIAGSSLLGVAHSAQKSMIFASSIQLISAGQRSGEAEVAASGGFWHCPRHEGFHVAGDTARRGLSMSEIKSEHSDGVIRRELESEECARFAVMRQWDNVYGRYRWASARKPDPGSRGNAALWT